MPQAEFLQLGVGLSDNHLHSQAVICLAKICLAIICLAIICLAIHELNHHQIFIYLLIYLFIYLFIYLLNLMFCFIIVEKKQYIQHDTKNKKQ